MSAQCQCIHTHRRPHTQAPTKKHHSHIYSFMHTFNNCTTEVNKLLLSLLSFCPSYTHLAHSFHNAFIIHNCPISWQQPDVCTCDLHCVRHQGACEWLREEINASKPHICNCYCSTGKYIELLCMHYVQLLQFYFYRQNGHREKTNFKQMFAPDIIQQWANNQL